MMLWKSQFTALQLLVAIILFQQAETFLIKEKFLPKFLNVDETEGEESHHIIKIPKLNLWKPWEDLFEKIEKKKELKEAKFEKDLDLIEEKKLSFDEKILEFFKDKDHLIDKLIEKKEEKIEKLEEKNKKPDCAEKSVEVVYEKKKTYNPKPQPQRYDSPRYSLCNTDDDDYDFHYD